MPAVGDPVGYTGGWWRRLVVVGLVLALVGASVPSVGQVDSDGPVDVEGFSLEPGEPVGPPDVKLPVPVFGEPKPAGEDVLAPIPVPDPLGRPNKPGWTADVVVAELSDGGGEVSKAGLPVSVAADSKAFAGDVSVRVEVVDSELAGSVSPLGAAAWVEFTDPATDAAKAAAGPFGGDPLRQTGRLCG